jgi:iron(II)-dependent oxidoreductase
MTSTSFSSNIDARETAAKMREFRARTLKLIGDLDDRQMIGPRLAIVNPPLWEVGHIAWFQEFWVLRHLRNERPLLENGDLLYNSTDVAHDTRWELLLPSRSETLRYMEVVLERCVGSLERAADISRAELYFYLLATFHEGMHAEALAYTRQTLGYPAPLLPEHTPPGPQGPYRGDAEIPGGHFLIGASPDFPFVFDNEKWAHAVEVRPFRIARAPVTNAEYAAFVDDGGYRDERYWSAAGWEWLNAGGAPALEKSFAEFFKTAAQPQSGSRRSNAKLEHPIYWRRDGGGKWQRRLFDRLVPLEDHLPVVHVSWYEAEAFCRWAGRRLPTEAEWEVAASAEPGGTGAPQALRRRFPWGDQPPSAERANLDWTAAGLAEVASFPAGDSAFGCRQMIGNVWEWTADDFLPYPGFTPDPYKEYSKPWFGTHKVLRGGCWATSSLLIRNTWRNFYTPDRYDVWAGFRTCAR